MATYLALSTTNHQTNGYTVYAYGADKTKVEEAAREQFGHPAASIWNDTLHKNLIVVSKSEAKRRYGINWDSSDVTEAYFGGDDSAPEYVR